MSELLEQRRNRRSELAVEYKTARGEEAKRKQPIRTFPLGQKQSDD